MDTITRFLPTALQVTKSMVCDEPECPDARDADNVRSADDTVPAHVALALIAALVFCVVALALIAALVFCVWRLPPSFSNPAAGLARTFSGQIPTRVQLAVSGITFHQRKINKLNEYTSWFESNREVPFVKPDTGLLHTVQPEDLFVHKYGGRQPQVWLRTEAKRWTPVEANCPHPRLNNYVLQISDKGEPRWVTKGTARKKARDLDRGRATPVHSP